jgi:hypothetical protein
MFGSPRALFEVTETEPGKVGTTRKPILHEGDRDGTLEVVSIDVEKSHVRIRNAGIETNITFEIPKLTAAPALPAIPGGVQQPLTPGVPLTPGGFNPPNAQNPLGRPNPVAYGNPNAGNPAASRTGVQGAYGNAGLRSIPTRSVPSVPPVPGGLGR